MNKEEYEFELSEMAERNYDAERGMEQRIAELEAALRAFEWRPIETAPCDGSLVLLYMPGGIVIAPSVKPERLPHDQARKLVRETLELPDYGKWNATHWMPLPEPPTKK